MKYLLKFILSVFLINCLVSQSHQSLRTVSSWKQLDFNFPNDQVRQTAIKSGQFNASNAVPIDVDVHYRAQNKSRIFVTIPRFSTGVPITLGIISVKKSANGPLITAYPNYGWHSSHGKDCNGITSVIRISIDECNRLWVIDNGMIGSKYFCPAQILIFDLNTDSLIRRYKIPAAQSPKVSLLITVAVDVRDAPPHGRCRDTLAYFADVQGFGLIVYDFKVNKSWRVTNMRFSPNTNNARFTIAGESFDLMDGVFGLALTKNKANPNRFLYFHSLASLEENIVPLRVLDNENLWKSRTNSNTNDFKTIGGRGTQTAAQAFDRNGNLYFGLINPIALACWDSDTPYNRQNIKIVHQNDKTLQFVSGLKVIKNLDNREELWALSNRFQKVSAGTINPNEINFRIQLRAIDESLGGQRKCNGKALSSFGSNNNNQGNNGNQGYSQANQSNRRYSEILAAYLLSLLQNYV